MSSCERIFKSTQKFCSACSLVLNRLTIIKMSENSIENNEPFFGKGVSQRIYKRGFTTIKGGSSIFRIRTELLSTWQAHIKQTEIM